MPLALPIELPRTRPLDPPACPYHKCACEHVGDDVQLGSKCPACGRFLRDVGVWPDVGLQELWHDEVFCWNHQKAELATIVAATYFEASEFHLLHWGTRFLDPDLNWIGASFEEVAGKSERIWKHLETIENRKATDEAYVRLFGVKGKTMLEKVLGADAAAFWPNYLRCRGWRNQILHRGRRLYFQTVPDDMQIDAAREREQMLWASLNFIPECWVVFSKLWNEYIHKPMEARRQRENP